MPIAILRSEAFFVLRDEGKRTLCGVRKTASAANASILRYTPVSLVQMPAKTIGRPIQTHALDYQADEPVFVHTPHGELYEKKEPKFFHQNVQHRICPRVMRYS
jgi:hypothetical protein